MAERRTNPRVKGPFEGFWDGSGQRAGRIIDLSISGCFIESATLPRIGQKVTVSIIIAGEEIRLSSEVVYPETPHGFAVRFLDASDDLLEVLKREISIRLA